MEFLYEYGLFLAKAVTFVIAVIVILGALAATAMKNKSPKKGELEVINLTKHFAELKNDIQQELLSKDELKALEKKAKEEEKADKKAKKEKLKAAKKSNGDDVEDNSKGKLYVIDFSGSMDAHEAENLREEVTAVLAVVTPKDEVLVRLESPGGVVHGYGLAASQLARIRQRDISLTVAVDKVAASGGYMMASVANQIVSAPFAIIGSIGVLAQIPNFNRLLKKHEIDYEQFTAGEFKRTVTLFGENTEAGKEKFKQELEETHELFKGHITEFRPSLDVARVATGEHWYGQQALELGLIDKIQTSDDYLLDRIENTDVFQVKYSQKKSLADKLPISAAAVVDAVFVKAWQRLQALKLQ